MNEKICVHEKVFSPNVLCSYPPKCEWICRICAKTGIDTIGKLASNEYERLLDLKENANKMAAEIMQNKDEN